MGILAFSDLDILSRVSLISWSVLTVVLSLMGNTFVLVASKHGKAIKLNRVSTVLLENLAVADIGTSLIPIMPLLHLLLKAGGVNSATTWIFKFGIVSGMIFNAASGSFISFLNCCKLFNLLFPLRARTWRYRDGYRIVAMVWITYTAEISGFILAGEGSYNLLMRVSAAGTLLLLMVVFASTFGLLLKVHKARGLRKQGVFSIILVSIVFFVCYTPIFVSHLFDSVFGFGNGFPQKAKHFLHQLFFKSSNILPYTSQFQRIHRHAI